MSIIINGTPPCVNSRCHRGALLHTNRVMSTELASFVRHISDGRLTKPGYYYNMNQTQVGGTSTDTFIVKTEANEATDNNNKTLGKMKMKMQMLSTSGDENMEAQGENYTVTEILELILVLTNVGWRQQSLRTVSSDLCNHPGDSFLFSSWEI